MPLARLLRLILVCSALCAGRCAAAAPAEWAGDLTPIDAAQWDRERAAHLLERAGFGGTPREVEHLAKMTPAQAVDWLVDYENTDDAGLPAFEPSGIYPNNHKLVGLEDVVLRGILTGKAYGIKATQPGKLKYQPAVNEFYTLLLSEHGEMRRAGQWWAERMLLTKRPMQEKLTLFWHDHFASSQEKVANYELMLRQIETLRTHANGNFRKLVTAVAQDPAMLIWLDNRENVKGKPNENFARELMELFCMGEGHGYTERDIREMARAFTGWTMHKPRLAADEVKFVDDKRLHDPGEKTFLGRTGRFSGYDAIDIVLAQEATPRFISGKLYRYFVREDLSPELNDKLGRVLLEAKYELKPLLKTMLLSRDFYSRPSVGTQIKGPVHYVISTYRKLGLQRLPGVPDFTDAAGSMGQVPFYPPNVAGWPDGRPWINPSTLLVRGNFMHTLLFVDAAQYGAPDKVIAEGYRKIPLMFPEYKIVPHVWSLPLKRMTPMSPRSYDRYLAGIEGRGTGMTDEGKGAADAAAPGQSMTPGMKAEPMKGDDKAPGKSRMSELARGEEYNLAVGVYSGFVEAGNRVKVIPRHNAEVDFVAMVKEAGAATASQAVDALLKRFLSVRLHDERRHAVIQFLTDELKSEALDYRGKALPEALRRTVHLILSAPEYQLG